MLDEDQRRKLSQILYKVGDMGFRRRVIAILDSLDLQDDDQVLDCGCGEGYYTMVISELYPRVRIVALDHDPEILGKAKKWLEKRKNIKFVLAEWNPQKPNDLPFPSGKFDKAILSEVIEHLENDFGAVKEMKRILKKDGLLAITVPAANYPFFWDPLNFIREHLGLGHFSSANQFLGGIWSWNHLRLYTPMMLSTVIKKAGLKELEMKPILRFVLPFNYWLLFLGKRLYTVLPVPEVVAKSMEKFEWQDDKSSSSMLTKVLKLPLILIDSLNDYFPGTLKNRHMCLFVITKKTEPVKSFLR